MQRFERMAYSKSTSKALFASRVVSVALCFWPVFSLRSSLFMMLLAFFYSHEHPVVFFVHASAKQGFNCQGVPPVTQAYCYFNSKVIKKSFLSVFFGLRPWVCPHLMASLSTRICRTQLLSGAVIFNTKALMLK